MNNIKIATAATMSTLISLFGCYHKNKIELKDEFIKVDTIAIENYEAKNPVLVLRMRLLNDSLITVNVGDENGSSSFFLHKFEMGKTYSINGIISDAPASSIAGWGSKNGILYLTIENFNQEEYIEKILKMKTEIEQIEKVYKVNKQKVNMLQ